MGVVVTARYRFAQFPTAAFVTPTASAIRWYDQPSSANRSTTSRRCLATPAGESARRVSTRHRSPLLTDDRATIGLYRDDPTAAVPVRPERGPFCEQFGHDGPVGAIFGHRVYEQRLMADLLGDTQDCCPEHALRSLGCVPRFGVGLVGLGCCVHHRSSVHDSCMIVQGAFDATYDPAEPTGEGT